MTNQSIYTHDDVKDTQKKHKKLTEVVVCL